jgi:hypothetical protein
MESQRYLRSTYAGGLRVSWANSLKNLASLIPDVVLLLLMYHYMLWILDQTAATCLTVIHDIPAFFPRAAAKLMIPL